MPFSVKKSQLFRPPSHIFHLKFQKFYRSHPAVWLLLNFWNFKATPPDLRGRPAGLKVRRLPATTRPPPLPPMLHVNHCPTRQYFRQVYTHESVHCFPVTLFPMDSATAECVCVCVVRMYRWVVWRLTAWCTRCDRTCAEPSVARRTHPTSRTSTTATTLTDSSQST